MKGKYLIIGMLLLSVTAVAQEEGKEKNQFTLDVQLRTRGEYRNGAREPLNEDEKAATFINNRARLTMEYVRLFDNEKLPKLTVRMGIQHVGVWGQDPSKDMNGRVSLNEGWAKIEGRQGLFAQIGRQQLAFDDERLFSRSDWHVAGCWHDALRVGYEKNAHKLHAVFAYNQNDENVKGGNYFGEGGQSYKSMLTFWYHYQKQPKGLGVSLLFANVGQETGTPEEAKTQYMQTMGTHLTYSPGKWNLSGSVYLQTGKNEERLSTLAFMMGMRAGYAISDEWRIDAGYDYLSGERYKEVRQADDGSYELIKKDATKSKAFSTLFGSGHGFYGSMDYFYSAHFIDGLKPGLQDVLIGATFKPSKRLSMSLTLHNFMTASNVLVSNKNLGQELDYRIDWKVMKDVTLFGGYSMMLGTKTMTFVKGGHHKRWQDWAWVSLNINPRIFSFKK